MSNLLFHKEIRVISTVFVSLLLLTSCNKTNQTSPQAVDYVNPIIGTTLQGNVCPDVGVPFGMTQWTPQTVPPAQKGVPPYRYYDPMIQGFQGSHWLSGGATQDYGSVTIMPITGKLNVLPQQRASLFNHNEEISTPYFYKVTLSDYNVVAEMTGTARCGFMKFQYPATDSAYVIIDSNAGYQPTLKNAKGKGFVKIIPGKREVVGYNPVFRMYQGWGKTAGFAGYFVVKFDKPFLRYGTWSAENAPEAGSTTANNQPGAFIRFKTSQKEAIKVKIGTSFTSIKEAEKNLKGAIPGWNFTEVEHHTRQIWNANLDRITVSGGTRQQKVKFYTALYHAMQLPRVISNEDSTYIGFDSNHKVYQARRHIQYGDYSVWDVFRADFPLFTLIEPHRDRDMVVSLIKKGEHGGFLPIFPAWDNYTSEMIGDHATAIIVDAYMKGIRNFNVQKAYQLMRKNAMQLPGSKKQYIAGKGRRALKAYMKYGYIPLNDSITYAFHHNEQVSRTLEYAYDDWALSQMSKVLHKMKDYRIFSKRGQNFKNVFDTTVGFVRGRYADGKWSKPFDPAQHYSYITEGTPWQYSWFVPQDVPALIRLMGGKKKFVDRLNTFMQKASRFHPGFRNTPYYTQGNEPDQQAPYLFDYAGAAWKTQYWVRQIMERSYQDNAGGLPGNDDAGQMSAWYVFSAMGFYPVCPGDPEYALGSPIFSKITLHIGKHKKFTIRTKNNSNKDIYIQSASLNGEQLDHPFISQKDIVNGGKLVLVMGAKPNKAWGSD